MQEHETRVNAEVVELEEKRQKLVDFMLGERYPELSAIDQGLLLVQQVAMTNYIDVLHKRIALFPREAPVRKTSIQLAPHEIQSGLNRQSSAEGLILQLPPDHEGRNTWLLNYGTREEAVLRRKTKYLNFSQHHQCATRSKADV